MFLPIGFFNVNCSKGWTRKNKCTCTCNTIFIFPLQINAKLSQDSFTSRSWNFCRLCMYMYIFMLNVNFHVLIFYRIVGKNSPKIYRKYYKAKGIQISSNEGQRRWYSKKKKKPEIYLKFSQSFTQELFSPILTNQPHTK